MKPIAIGDIPTAARKNRLQREPIKKYSTRAEEVLADYERIMEELRLAREHKLIREELILSFRRDALTRTLHNMYEAGQL